MTGCETETQLKAVVCQLEVCGRTV